MGVVERKRYKAALHPNRFRMTTMGTKYESGDVPGSSPSISLHDRQWLLSVTAVDGKFVPGAAARGVEGWMSGI